MFSVTTPAGTGTELTAYGYIVPSAPTVTGVVPNSGSSLGGTSVTITGTFFTGAFSVTFGGSAATGVTVVNDSTITATTSGHAAGLVNVAVTDAEGYRDRLQPLHLRGTADGHGRQSQPGHDAWRHGGHHHRHQFNGATNVTFGGVAAKRDYRRQCHHHQCHNPAACRRPRECRRHHSGRHGYRNQRLYLHRAADRHRREPA